jgi:hypothetical protein
VKTTSTLKDLRVFAGRLEANITALEVALNTYTPKQGALIDKVSQLKTLMAEIREDVEKLEV